MSRGPIPSRGLALLAVASIAGTLAASAAWGQTFRYESKPKLDAGALSYASPDPAPSPRSIARDWMPESAAYQRPRNYGVRQAGYADPRDAQLPAHLRGGFRLAAYAEPIARGNMVDPFAEEPIPPGRHDTSYGELPPQPYSDYYADGPTMDGPSGPGRPSHVTGPMWQDWYSDPAFDQGCQQSCDCHQHHHHCQGMFCCFKESLRQCELLKPAFWQNFNTFSGAQAFKGPVDRGVNGNFGFHKAVNWASPLWDAKGIGFQLGGMIALSDFNGGSGLVNHNRNQYFLTTGLFRRAECFQGWQGGVVFDYLHDDFYVTMNLMQIRTELSWLCCKGHELGYWGATAINEDTANAPAGFGAPTVTWLSNSQYNLFYRFRFCNGATGRMWAGLTNHGDIIFGNDGTAPLSERWAIQASYNYLMPTGNSAIPNDQMESWNLSVALVWYPGYKVPNACFNPYRPLFGVADNGTFLITEKR